MTTPPPIPKSRRPSKWPLALCICLLLSPFVGGFVWFASYRVSNASAVRKLEARAKQRGEPITLVELQQRFPPIPDEENAAVALLALWETKEPKFWKAFQRGERPLPTRAARKIPAEVPFIGQRFKVVPRSEQLPEVNRAAAESHLAEHREHMHGVRRALQRPRFRFPIKITDGYAALLPHLPEMKNEALRFQVEALLEADRADVRSSISALRDITRIGNILADDPFLIAHLVRAACFSMSINGAERLLSRQELSRDQLHEMRMMLAGISISNALKASLISDRATALSLFDMKPDEAAQLFDGTSDEDGTPTSGVDWSISLLAATGGAMADRRLTLETFERGIALSKQDSPQALLEFKQLISNAAVRSRQFPPKIFSGLTIPALERAADRFASLEARRRAALTAVSVEAYRLAHNGVLPSGIDSLVPKFLTVPHDDPFDGKPLRFKTLANGYVIYSIGPDRIDQDGTEQSSKSNPKGFDETFIVER